jgi:hypothetical protein
MEVVEEEKLLRVILTSDLKWSANTKYIVGRAKKKLWILKRVEKRQTRRTLRVLQKKVVFLIS